MGSVPVTTEGSGGPSYQRRDETMEVRAGVLRKGHDFLKENGSRSSEGAGNLNHGINGALQAQVGLQIHHQPPRVSVVRWERYLPRRSLKVLLVEDDDSTRHLVSALLRNCGYEVTAATNGLQAWNILVDLTNHIDLVLTEVDMPDLSGIGLLCKVMSHRISMNIPVIMMSSNDPMVLVLKCLSKGAVDFLVKPIRKNELKNLWQHVWRKCQCSSDSDSGSESGIHMQKSKKEKNAEKSVNNNYSNIGNENGGIDLNVRDGSDSGSETQSSWIKRGVDVDKPPPMVTGNSSVFPADSTCAHVIRPINEALGNDMMATMMRRCPKDNEKLKGKGLKNGVPGNQEREHVYKSEEVSCTKQDEVSAQDPKKENEPLKEKLLELQNKDPMGEIKEKTAGLTGLIASGTEPLVENVPKLLERKNNFVSDLNNLTSSKSKLKRPREVGTVTDSNQDGNVPRHTNNSSFLRYNNGSTSNHVSSAKVGRRTQTDNNSGTSKKESTTNILSNSNRNPDLQWKETSNNNKTDSITGDVLTMLTDSKGESTSMTKVQHTSSLYQQMQTGYTCQSQEIIHQKTVDARREDQQVQVQHHHHHHHYYHHHMHEMQQEQSHPYEDMQENMETVSLQSGSSNVFNRPSDASGRKYSSNGSGSGSKHGSNTLIGSNTDVNAGEADLQSENMVPGKLGGCFGNGVENRRGINGARYMTEATMNKIIQKKKDKYFNKKVDSKSGRS